jgi:hypothetical protein
MQKLANYYSYGGRKKNNHTCFGICNLEKQENLNEKQRLE